MSQSTSENGRRFPTVAGISLLHQVLQWHHMFTSAGYPANNLENLEFNVMWDGFFHISTYLFTATGMTILWREASRPHAPWSGKMLVGSMFMGFGIFNLVEGIVDHHILGLHHVNETVPPDQWIYWDIAFLVWGALMLVGGLFLWQAGKRATSSSSITGM